MAQTENRADAAPVEHPPPYARVHAPPVQMQMQPPFPDPAIQYPQSYNPADLPALHSPPRHMSHDERMDDFNHEPPKYAQPPPPPQPRAEIPLNEAVESAFDKADPAAINPELIAQITENVIKQLRSSNETAHIYPPPPPRPTAPLSPTSTTGTSPPLNPRNVYTPPSPHRHPDYPLNGSPELKTSMPVREGVASSAKDILSEERQPSPTASTTSDAPASNARPKVETQRSSVEETTIEKIWGPLFDGKGKPTARLGQFLRGIATYMIEVYEPKCSLVLTPPKMAKFYQEMSVPDDPYPWEIVFDDTQTSISRMYRELECEHYLVQEPDHLDEKPSIPALTTAGFQRWATMMIQAHPREEFERFKKVARELPIDNPDNRKERLPKELSRRLFPSCEDFAIRDWLIDAVQEHARVDIDVRPASPPLQPAKHFQERRSSRSLSNASRGSDSTPVAPSIERERKPYSSIPNESAIDDMSTPTPQSSQPPPQASTQQPIERERKPYTSTPGRGRIYSDQEPRGSNASSNAPPPPPSTLLNSTSALPPQPTVSSRPSIVRTPSMSGTRPITIPHPIANPASASTSALPPQRQSHEYPPPPSGPPMMDMYGQSVPYRAGGVPPKHKQRSPSMSSSVPSIGGEFRRSDTAIYHGMEEDERRYSRDARDGREARRVSPPKGYERERGEWSERDRERDTPRDMGRERGDRGRDWDREREPMRERGGYPEEEFYRPRSHTLGRDGKVYDERRY